MPKNPTRKGFFFFGRRVVVTTPLLEIALYYESQKRRVGHLALRLSPLPSQAELALVCPPPLP